MILWEWFLQKKKTTPVIKHEIDLKLKVAIASWKLEVDICIRYVTAVKMIGNRTNN